MVLVMATGLMLRMARAHAAGRRVLTRLGATIASPPLSDNRTPNWWPRTTALTAGAVGGRWAAGWAGCAIGAGVALLAWDSWARVCAGREAAQVERDLPMCMETIARILRSGTSPTLAVKEAAATIAGPLGVDLHHLAIRAEQFGLRASAQAWSRRRPAATLAARALVVALDAGYGTADALDAVAVTLRDRAAVAREVRALASQARLSAGVMACTPIGFAVLLSGSDAGARAFLLHSPIGLACLAVGLTLDLLGYQWMRAIARVVV